MRKKILLDGPKISHDKRGWYAVIAERYIEKEKVTVLDCDVYHPKDSPDNPGDRPFCYVMIATDIDTCIDVLTDDGWLDNGTDPDVFDFPPPNYVI